MRGSFLIWLGGFFLGRWFRFSATRLNLPEERALPN